MNHGVGSRCVSGGEAGPSTPAAPDEVEPASLRNMLGARKRSRYEPTLDDVVDVQLVAQQAREAAGLVHSMEPPVPPPGGVAVALPLYPMKLLGMKDGRPDWKIATEPEPESTADTPLGFNGYPLGKLMRMPDGSLLKVGTNRFIRYERQPREAPWGEVGMRMAQMKPSGAMPPAGQVRTPPFHARAPPHHHLLPPRDAPS